jgi:tRNA pseudouridine55 synthase
MTTSNGLLLVDKPQGLTSHDVVARVRKILNERRVGHAGTLDPMATGLLVLAVGPSTRLLRFAQSEIKRYTGTVKFGIATDSLDADGEIVANAPVPALTSDEMTIASSAFTGSQRQTPPMVSAIKVGGRRLHELARQGIEVEREARDVTISEFVLTPSDDPSIWTFNVECTVGTYVRVLLSDLAERIGTVGHLTSLRRVSSGGHSIDDAVTLDAFEEIVRSGGVALRPPADFVTSLEHVRLSDDEQRRMRMGQHLVLEGDFVADEIAATSNDDSLVGILRRRGEKWKPEVVLPSDSEADRN